MRIYPFLLAASLSFTSPASLPPTLDIISSPGLSNLTSANPQDQTNGSAVDGAIWFPFCTKNPKWSLPKVNAEDCLGVLDYFYYETMHEGGTLIKEFVSPEETRPAGLEPEWTPRKYTFSTCTLAIVMVQDFPNPGSLPGGRKTGPPSDFSTYHALWKVAENVVQHCVQRQGKMGWQAAGLRGGIGVFIWSTHSREDKEIEADEPRFMIPAREAMKNGSVANVRELIAEKK